MTPEEALREREITDRLLRACGCKIALSLPYPPLPVAPAVRP